MTGGLSGMKLACQTDSLQCQCVSAMRTPQVRMRGRQTGQRCRLEQVSSQKAVVKDEIDPAFNIDQYNLLFPLHLFFRDSSAKVEGTGIHKLPMGKGSAMRVVVTYPSEGGYT